MKLGIDIGGTTINIGALENGVLVSKSSFPSFSPDSTLDQTIEYLCSLIEKFFNSDVESIGIGVPSVVDVEKGIVYNTANIPSWKEVHLKEDLEARFNVPVHINNDANCYAIGAAAELKAPSKGLFLTITLGTGVGIGLVYDGKIVNGANTGLGELTWLPYKGKPVEYWCGKSFFLDKGHTPLEFYEMAQNGDKTAIEVFEEYGENLAVMMCVALSAYDPDIVVFGGGLSHSRKYFEPKMLELLAELFPFPKSISKLKISYLSESDAAIIGACLL